MLKAGERILRNHVPRRNCMVGEDLRHEVLLEKVALCQPICEYQKALPRDGGSTDEWAAKVESLEWVKCNKVRMPGNMANE